MDRWPDIVQPDMSQADLYLDLMKRCLTGWIYADEELRREEDFLSRPGRILGRSWPRAIHTMIGRKRLDNLQFCIESVLSRRIPGDLIETGVWRGGATIFMRAVLKVHSVENRSVWVADSFEGFPPPTPEKYPNDARYRKIARKDLVIPLEEVKANFEGYGLLDDQVRFLKGYFRDTLPEAPIKELAVLRLDGDMYESTMDALVNLYPKLSIGGYLIVDDYGALLPCQQAVEDYRERENITEEIMPIDWTGVFWQRRE